MSSSTDKQKIFHQLNQYESPSINTILKIIIENIETLDIKNGDKKEIAIDILKDYLVVIPPSDYKVALIGAIDNDIISEVIDLIVMASKNQLKLNKKTFKKLFINCLKFVLHISKSK